ncbi:MAG: hypothetical protein ACYTGL_09455 [Planctomycetota bacterium]|jgi:membrane protein involved in colicin uptake
MLDLLKHLWHDEVGSSQSTEMALVTGVTVGAMVMGMRSFGEAVNNRFTKIEHQENATQQLEQQIKEERRRKELSEEERLHELRQRRQKQLERKRQQAEQDETAAR